MSENIVGTKCLFVCYMNGTPESPLPLNPGQGSDSPGTVAVTRSTSVREQRVHVPGTGIRPRMSDTFKYLFKGSPMILSPGA